MSVAPIKVGFCGCEYRPVRRRWGKNESLTGPECARRLLYSDVSPSVGAGSPEGQDGDVYDLSSSFVLANKRLAVHAFLQRRPTPTAHGKPSSSASDDFPQAKLYLTPDEFFADSEIDLVVVATGHDSHADLAIRALKAKKHGALDACMTCHRVLISPSLTVVVEKCFTLGSQEADRVIEAQRESGGKVLTVFQSEQLAVPVRRQQL